MALADTVFTLFAFGRNAAACTAAISAPGNDPLYYMTGRTAVEIERLQADNVRLRTALAEIVRLANELGVQSLPRCAAEALEQKEQE